ncbi:GAF domain-containing protein [Pseudoxanthomonas japonensis]|uniref:GAF domain-containing protein n=1 Tax=Pseudoxanthomonas japonensis TaxID=69284 RepID=UPI001A4AF9F3|nr:GAF domain-containing protein [Pseudoxanthomonas japonensis]MBL8257964.1 GAF domain-containing protein [Pseudoxanthomonas mexicana]MDR7067589.1 GAF domain-containing protein [Pseudoxanthomonas japonensis]
MTASTASPAVQERQRQHALDRYHALDTLPATVYDDLVNVAAAICGTPIAVVSLIDRDRQWFKARVGLDGHETTRDTAVCDHAIRQPDELLEIQDLSEDARFNDFPIVTGDVKARFYAGMPLVTGNGEAIGTVCVVDTQPRRLNSQQKASMRSLARVTMALLDAHRAQHEVQALAALQVDATVAATPAISAPTATGPVFAVVIIELQGMAEVARRLGDRTLERQLQGLAPDFDACVTSGAGDHVSRVTDSPEYVALLHGDDLDARVQALRQAARKAGQREGFSLLVGAATATPGEAMHLVYLRAEEDLSLQKDAAAGERAAA